MQKPSKITLLLSLSAFAILAMLAAACTPVDLSGAAGGSGCSQENGDGDNDFCELIEGNPNSGSWSVPGSEYTITSFVIKAGTETFGAVAGCYDVSLSGSSVSWNRVGDGSNCKDISHVEIYYTYNPPPPPPPPQNVQYCRATGNPYPYEVATAQLDAGTNKPTGFVDGKDIYPVPTGGCPTEPPPPPPPQEVQYCKATGNPYPYTVATAQLDSSTNQPVGFGAQDIYPVPTGGCPTEPPPPPPPQNVQYCRATGDPYPYEVATAQLDTTTNLPVGFNGSKDMYPIPTGGCPTPPPPQRITLCHATGSETNPYVELTINYNGTHGHEDHGDDLIPVPADGCPTPKKITICHATGSATNPYVQLNIQYMGLHGHEGHADDLIPMPAGGCPPPPPQRITVCHATGSTTNPYVEVTIDYNGLHGHEGHASDIIPMPAGGCPQPPTQVTICHATGNPYPYEEVTVSVMPGGTTGHQGHPLDISPVPAGGCPQPPPPPPVQFCQATGDPYPYQLATAQLDPNTNKPVGFNADKDVYPVPLGGCPQEPPEQTITICHATGNPYPYVEMRVQKDADTGLPVGHEGHSQDIVPMPDGGCPTEPPPNDETVIVICHANGDPYPYTRLRIVYDPLVGHGHEGHTDDIIPAPRGGCPTEPPPPQITICHASGTPYPFVEMTVDQNPVTGEPIGHEAHTDDIVPMPADGCPQEPPEQTINICHATGDPYPYVLVTETIDLVTGLHGHEGDTNDIIPAPVDGCPTDDEPPVIPPAPPPVANCPQFLIFHTFRDENLEIYRLDGVEGDPDSELINLTNSDAVDCRPSRSPDDAWIVYQSDRNDNVELYYTDLGGSSQIRLTTSDSNNINPIFGPDNRTVAFQSDRNGNWDIFTTDLLTQGLRQLTSSVYDEVNPFWSPDLRWLAFQTNRNGNWDIYVLDTQTGNEYALATGAGDQIYPAWSPNGQQIAYLSDVNGVWNLYVIDYTGQNLLQITDGNGDTTNATWSPEGYRIAYQSERSGNVDVYSYDLRTDSEYRLTSYAGSDSGPTWDCGGTNIAFTSTRDGNPNVLQVFWQGGAQSNLTLDPATDKWSQWSPSKEPASRGR